MLRPCCKDRKSSLFSLLAAVMRLSCLLMTLPWFNKQTILSVLKLAHTWPLCPDWFRCGFSANECATELEWQVAGLEEGSVALKIQSELGTKPVAAGKR